MKHFLLFLLVVSTYTQANTNHFENPRWLKLFRYQKTLLGNFESEVDEKTFFVTKDGKNNPQSEYKKSLELAFENKSISSDHFICQFPARATILSELEGRKLPFDLKKCKAFQDYLTKVKLHSVSLVFSSYFIQNPASAFGHTFLRLRGEDSVQEDNDLLDYGVDYSAQVTTNNPILYGIYGILGGFFGQFKMMPYYYKIREYNDSESRDLWDYEINFTAKDKALFMAHLFEMQKARFDYFYFTENCSYHVLSLLDAIRPDWDLMRELDSFLPPVQTIYALYQQDNIVKNVKYRPSIFKKAWTRFENLSKDEKENFFLLIEGKKKLNQIGDVNVIDAYSDYIDYKYSKDLEAKTGAHHEKANDLKFDVNLRRSEIKEKSQDLDFSREFINSPDRGHDTKRIRLGGAKSHDTYGIDLEYRFSFHDFLDNKKGFIPFSSTQMGIVKFRFDDEITAKVEDFTVVAVDAMRPFSSFDKSMSWRFSFGLKDPTNEKRQNINPFIDFSYGVSFNISNLMLGGFLATSQEYGFNYEDKYHLSFGPELLLIYSGDSFSLALNYKRFKEINFMKDYSSNMKGEARYFINKKWASYLSYEKKNLLNEKMTTGLLFYF
ncbi:PF13387 domain protein [Bacteriovorax sp. BSW11_IV]|uniref:Lnb N-terminal periplasmic domain-containing protein n=1 Tax=Bacteriovorax sp. BSW11_IV TaxID=1353529 RepID=UPI000389EC26|nr:DUF4105 domain-containing protein [Bacteriovorax sp. BSW11_IV]EQC48261.1 PF13387 domain protein [Bacteriovorax sp. BSW11_IV]